MKSAENLITVLFGQNSFAVGLATLEYKKKITWIKIKTGEEIKKWIKLSKIWIKN